MGLGLVYCTKWTKVARDMGNDIPGLDTTTPITLSVEEFQESRLRSSVFASFYTGENLIAIH